MIIDLTDSVKNVNETIGDDGTHFVSLMHKMSDKLNKSSARRSFMYDPIPCGVIAKYERNDISAFYEKGSVYMASKEHDGFFVVPPTENAVPCHITTETTMKEIDWYVDVLADSEWNIMIKLLDACSPDKHTYRRSEGFGSAKFCNNAFTMLEKKDFYVSKVLINPKDRDRLPENKYFMEGEMLWTAEVIQSVWVPPRNMILLPSENYVGVIGEFLAMTGPQGGVVGRIDRKAISVVYTSCAYAVTLGENFVWLKEV